MLAIIISCLNFQNSLLSDFPLIAHTFYFNTAACDFLKTCQIMSLLFSKPSLWFLISHRITSSVLRKHTSSPWWVSPLSLGPHFLLFSPSLFQPDWPPFCFSYILSMLSTQSLCTVWNTLPATYLHSTLLYFFKCLLKWHRISELFPHHPL